MHKTRWNSTNAPCLYSSSSANYFLSAAHTRRTFFSVLFIRAESERVCQWPLSSDAKTLPMGKSATRALAHSKHFQHLDRDSLLRDMEKTNPSRLDQCHYLSKQENHKKWKLHSVKWRQRRTNGVYLVCSIADNFFSYFYLGIYLHSCFIDKEKCVYIYFFTSTCYLPEELF